MHKRFVTSANAQKATLDFENVKYDHTTGPDGLMNELIKYGQCMREKPSPFTIRSVFFEAIPDDMCSKLVLDRGFTREHSNAEDLLDHARQLWVGTKLIRGRRSRSAPVPAGTRLNTTIRTTTSGVNTISSTTATTTLNPRPGYTLITGGSFTKQCFACGLFGHIASDLMCAKNRDQPGFREHPRVAAQRVVESYTDEDDTEIHADHEMVDDAEEQWGGSQYETDPNQEGDDPNIAPDLDELVEALDPEDHPELPR
ncbi:hypothetical protein DFH09DRAFT_1303204 [Mycena vulgaris]|nr:hypothetical protein DFH09DRAFT_1303204 [Mycena vulgaris]